MSADDSAKTAADPSMDDILASIRRILTEEEVSPDPEGKTQSGSAEASIDLDEVFSLDETMLVAPSPAPAIEEPPSPTKSHPPVLLAPVIPAPAIATAAQHPPQSPPAAPAVTPLIAPEAEAAAASALGDLVRSVQAERHTAVYRGGPTIEDLVRAEIRPVLKSWLDNYLPEIVERLVRMEIERVAGRVTGI
jgi:cell pole-organizing protein PopZ